MADYCVLFTLSHTCPSYTPLVHHVPPHTSPSHAHQLPYTSTSSHSMPDQRARSSGGNQWAKKQHRFLAHILKPLNTGSNGAYPVAVKYCCLDNNGEALTCTEKLSLTR
ncbi:hypothetical protein E2C01_053288 [Portunus trituberculatus]|uniref:Uncharacterized protein n=1 Tax=Portunus trituberculatus TaxID=210409 RepID=A0A5B7GJW8_PORTR|nr:hypothetical protein [Portunus trituberculatus]